MHIQENNENYTNNMPLLNEKLLGNSTSRHVKELISGSTQTALSYLLEWLPNLVCLIFLGQYTPEDKNQAIQAGFGLGILWANVFGFGLLTALSSGLETMTSQAFGSRSYKTTSLQFWQNITVICILMLPISIIQSFPENLLNALFDKPDICEIANQVTRGFIPAIFINGIYSTTKCFLTGQNIYSLTLITQAITSSLHVLWCYLFIPEYGIIGALISRTLTEVLNVAIIWSIILYTKCCAKTLSKPKTIGSLLNYLQVAVPIGLLSWLEWLSYEMYSFQAGWLTDEMLSANINMNNFSSFYFQFSFGIAIAATTYIGTSMGKDRPYQAQTYCKWAFILNASFLSFSQLILWIFRAEFVSIFTKDEAVQYEILNVFPLFSALMITDSIQGILTGVVRGIGHEKWACIMFLFFYLIFGQVISYLLTQCWTLDLNGILIGMVSGTVMYDLFMVATLILTNWEKQASQISCEYKKKELQIQ